jgi:membrane protease YdiL (CAAX protease family)
MNKFCSKCGRELTPGSDICQYCENEKNEEKKIASFDELLNDTASETLNNSNAPFKTGRSASYLFIILCEILLSVLGLLFSLIIVNNPKVYQDINTEKYALNMVTHDNLGVTLLSLEEFESLFDVSYPSYIESEIELSVNVIGYSLTYEKILVVSKSIDYFLSDDIDDFIYDYFLSSKTTDLHLYLSINMVPSYVSYIQSESTIIALLGDYIIPRREIIPFYLSLVNGISYVIVLILIIFFGKLDIKEDFVKLKTLKKTHNIFNEIFVGTLTMFGIGLLINLAVAFIEQLLHIEASESINQESIDSMMLTFSSAIILIPTVVLIGPFVEEMVFRKSIFGLIPNKNVAWVVSSLLFGLIHVTEEPSILLFFFNGISYVGLGFVIGYLYKKHNYNIFMIYGIHAGYNLVSVLLNYLIFSIS